MPCMFCLGEEIGIGPYNDNFGNYGTRYDTAVIGSQCMLGATMPVKFRRPYDAPEKL